MKHFYYQSIFHYFSSFLISVFIQFLWWRYLIIWIWIWTRPNWGNHFQWVLKFISFQTSFFVNCCLLNKSSTVKLLYSVTQHRQFCPTLLSGDAILISPELHSLLSHNLEVRTCISSAFCPIRNLIFHLPQ